MNGAANLTADRVLAGYARLRARRLAIVAALALLCVAAFVLDLVTGPSGLTPGQVLRGLLAPDQLTAPQRVILWQVRLPYALMAVLVGAALSLAGAEMQTILNNPLASPFTLGVSSAASFGAALAIVLGLSLPLVPSEWMVPLNAFIFAFGSVLLLQLLARQRSADVETVVLLGIALVFAFNALVALLQFVSAQEALQQLVFWTMGSLSRATWNQLAVFAVALLLVVPWSLHAASRLTSLRLGEDRARSFGVDVARLRFLALLRVSLLAAVSVAFAGTIGFIGLVGPHIARLLLGEDHRFLLPASLLCGALIMSLASAASKVLVPGALMPVGIVTSIVGVPVFLFLIFRKPGRARSGSGLRRLAGLVRREGRAATAAPARTPQSLATAAATGASADDALRVQALSCGYRHREVIQQQTLPPLRAGQVHALLGPNAAGKSTLLRGLAGLQPAQGSVRLGQRELVGLSLAEHARHVTYMPQTLPQGVALSVLESVIGALRASASGDAPAASTHAASQRRAVAILERVGILHLALDHLDQLSGGQRQLASLAQALVREPRVLLLDEPISALDLQHQFSVMQLVHALARERGMVVLVVLHDLQSAARWCDGIVMLAGGAVVATGTPAQAITPDTLARVYGVRARVEHSARSELQIMVDSVLPSARQS